MAIQSEAGSLEGLTCFQYGAFQNDGQVVVSGSGLAQISLNITNTGLVKVDSGTLLLGGGGLTGTSSDTISGDSGTTLLIQGSWTFTSTSSITADTLDLEPATLNLQINGQTSGAGFPNITVTNTAAIGGQLNLEMLNGFTPSLSEMFTILDYQGTNAISGIFTGLPEGACITSGTTKFQISYVGGDGNDVVLTAVAIANAGGPYTVTYGNSLTLDASASTDLYATPTYSWTINGQANAASGVSPTLTWSQLAALGVSTGQVDTVSVQVNDGHGSPVTAQTSLTVNAEGTTTALSAPTITYGQDGLVTVAVSANDSFGGSPTGSVSLTVDGGNPTSGTLSNGSYTFDLGVLGAGTYSLSATYTDPANNYGTSFQTDGSLQVNKANQTITVTVPVPASAVYNSTFNVAATADSGLAVSIAASAGAAGTGSGSAAVTMTSGTTAGTVTFSQAGNANYNPAPVVVETVSAQASSVSISGDVYVLNQTASGALTISGNAVLNVEGTLQVDSSAASAVNLSGNADVNAAQALIVGSDQVSGNAHFNHRPTTHAADAANPLAGQTTPTGGTNMAAVNLSNGTLIINPGVYPSITVSGNAHLILNPGVYSVGSGGITISGNATMTGGTATGGQGVFIYNNGVLTVSGNASVNLMASSTGPYAGLAIFQAQNDGSAVTVSGNANLNLNGSVLYAANVQCVVNISGNAELEASLVVNELTISGNADDTAQ